MLQKELAMKKQQERRLMVNIGLIQDNNFRNKNIIEKKIWIKMFFSSCHLVTAWCWRSYPAVSWKRKGWWSAFLLQRSSGSHQSKFESTAAEKVRSGEGSSICWSWHSQHKSSTGNETHQHERFVISCLVQPLHLALLIKWTMLRVLCFYRDCNQLFRLFTHFRFRL